MRLTMMTTMMAMTIWWWWSRWRWWSRWWRWSWWRCCSHMLGRGAVLPASSQPSFLPQKSSNIFSIEKKKLLTSSRGLCPSAGKCFPENQVFKIPHTINSHVLVLVLIPPPFRSPRFPDDCLNVLGLVFLPPQFLHILAKWRWFQVHIFHSSLFLGHNCLISLPLSFNIHLTSLLSNFYKANCHSTDHWLPCLIHFRPQQCHLFHRSGAVE